MWENDTWLKQTHRRGWMGHLWAVISNSPEPCAAAWGACNASRWSAANLWHFLSASVWNTEHKQNSTNSMLSEFKSSTVQSSIRYYFYKNNKEPIIVEQPLSRWRYIWQYRRMKGDNGLKSGGFGKEMQGFLNRWKSKN